jgi:hypothetical protein
MILLHRQALNKHLSNYKQLQGAKMDPACTFCRLRGTTPLPNETPVNFYSQCIFIQRLWTEIRDRTAPQHNSSFTIRDRVLGIANQGTYSISNTLLRETRSTIWKARISKQIPTLREVKQRLKQQIPNLLIVNSNAAIKQGLIRLQNMAEN